MIVGTGRYLEATGSIGISRHSISGFVGHSPAVRVESYQRRGHPAEQIL